MLSPVVLGHKTAVMENRPTRLVGQVFINPHPQNQDVIWQGDPGKLAGCNYQQEKTVDEAHSSLL